MKGSTIVTHLLDPAQRLNQALIQRAAAGLVFLLLIGALSVPAAAETPASSYARAMAQSHALEAAGEVEQALASLQPLDPHFPQDYALLLRLGWLSFSAGNYPLAEGYYRRAHALSGGAADARHGLAWTLLRQGDPDAARTLFRWVLAIQPKNKTAREGLALCREEPVFGSSPSAGFIGHLYQNHYLYTHAVGGRIALPMTILEHLLISPVYRYQRFFVDNVDRALNVLEDDFNQHEVYVSAGAVFPSFGIIGHYGWVKVGSDLVDDAHIAGLSLRYSPYGDITLSASASLYSDMNVYRTVAAWRIPLPWVPWLAVTVGGSVQLADADAYSYQLDAEREVLGAGLLNISAVFQRFALRVGARVGAEVRPVFLHLPAVNNSTDREEFSVWAGGRVALGGGFTADLAYELAGLENRYTTNTNLMANKAFRHLLSLGVGYHWSTP